MKELEMAAQAGHSAEFTERNNELKELRTLAILDNYLKIYPTNLKDYATGPIEEAFDWTDVHTKLLHEYDLPADTALDVFAFYSRPNPNRDAKGLNEADLGAFFATRDLTDEFLYYQRDGIVDQNGNALVFCVWSHRKYAHVLSGSGDHDHAASYADSSYIDGSTQWLRTKRADNGEGVTISKSKRNQLPLGHLRTE